MTTKTLTGVYFSTYDLTSPVTTLSIAASGYLVAGVTASGTGTYTLVNAGVVRGYAAAVSLAGQGVVTNAGTIVETSGVGGAGVALAGGGAVANGAGDLIRGYSGVVLGTSTSTVTNYGQIMGSKQFGVDLAAGGTVVNGGTAATEALIRGAVGVQSTLPGTLRNFGTVGGIGASGIGVELESGGVVVNGAAGDHAATLIGAEFGLLVVNAAGTLSNYGTVRATGTSSIGAAFTEGGTITNGSAADTSAVIEGVVGVVVEGQAGVVRNFGTVKSDPGTDTGIFGAVYLKAGGTVTNGSNADTAAVIDGFVGVYGGTISTTVINFGAVGDASSLAGVALKGGGRVTNGSATDTAAVIEGYFGVAGTAGPITVNNFGTIRSTYGSIGVGPFVGLFAIQGGRVTNGGTADTGALIAGDDGVYATTAAFTVTNFGTVRGSTDGVDLKVGGAVTNGAANDTAALIEGTGYGVYFEYHASAIGNLTNFGTILAGLGQGAGAGLFEAGTLTNGSVSDHAALIKAWVGVELRDQNKAINWGTIAGDSNIGVGAVLGYRAVLTNEAGGLVSGHTGAEVDAYATLSNFGAIDGSLAVALGYATSRLNAEAGSVFAGLVMAGSGTVDAVAGTSAMMALSTQGHVIGAGTISLNGGASVFGAGAALTVAQISLAGAASVVEVETKLVDAKVWRQSGGTLKVDSGDQMSFTGAGDTFAGTLTGAGKLTFTGAGDSFANVTLSGASMILSAASATLSGAIVLTTTLKTTSPDVVIAAGGATLSGGGTLLLTNKASNKVIGASASATLTNFDRIVGAGQLGGGSMILVNKAGGVIDGNAANQLIIATGVGTIANAGLIEATGTGGVMVAGPVHNTGTLSVSAGTLAITGAVSGAGVVRIGGGVADFGFTFAENVTFTGTTGVLELARSQTYTGTVGGFSKTGTTSLDLLDIASGTASASYSGTTTAGVLTVTDGTHTAKIHLAGDYTASSFIVSSDGHGGTKVVDPVKSGAAARRLIALGAAMGAPAAGAETRSAEPWRERPPALLAPRTHFA
ncbi:MAG TPA: hypothetical protein VG166_12305 [Caulobacteraceae bacterium]|nr:hypothetical protein [Caulobacteraceae bacterium]